MQDQDLMVDYNDYRHEYDGWDDAPACLGEYDQDWEDDRRE